MKVTKRYRLVFGLAGILPAAVLASDVGRGLSDAGAAVSLVAGQPEDEPAAEAEPPLPLESETGLLKGWDGSIQFGINGSTGNTEELDVLGKFDAQRETDKNLTVLGARFEYGTAEGDTTDNEFDFTGRESWKFRDPRWRLYVQGMYEYDEFEDWDHRITFGPGLEYEAIKNDTTDLLLRGGLQVRKEIGGEDNGWTPESLLGFNATHQLTERQSLEAAFNFYPALDRFGPYRFDADVGWKIEVDPEANLFLRLGIHDEYDSSPGPDRKRNDLDYYATLGWSF